MRTKDVRAFEGPNGWYVADVMADGSHYQPRDGGNMSETAAKKQAAAERKQPAFVCPEGGDCNEHDCIHF